MEFKEILKLYKSALGKGDAQAIADEANVSKQTVYNMLECEYSYQLTVPEERAYRVMIKRLSPKIKAGWANEKKALVELGIYGTV